MTFIETIGSVNCSSKSSIFNPSFIGYKNEEALDSLVKSVRERLFSFCERGSQNETNYWRECVGEENTTEAMRLYESTLESGHDVLHRILVARNYNIDLSTDLFFEQIRWRARWRPNNIRFDQIPNALTSGAWRLCGHSKEGIIMSNYKLEFWDADKYGNGIETSSGENFDSFKAAVDEYVRYVAFMIELMISKIPPSASEQKFMVIFDLKGFSSSLIFKSNVRHMIRNLIYVAQAQYPERLHKVLLVNAPYGFSAAWKLISALLDQKTVSKVHFVSVSQIADNVDLHVLPAEYGGTHDEYPLPTVE